MNWERADGCVHERKNARFLVHVQCRARVASNQVPKAGQFYNPRLSSFPTNRMPLESSLVP